MDTEQPCQNCLKQAEQIEHLKRDLASLLEAIYDFGVRLKAIDRTWYAEHSGDERQHEEQVEPEKEVQTRILKEEEDV